MLRKLTGIRHVALDMDGTIYSGETLFSDTLPFLDLVLTGETTAEPAAQYQPPPDLVLSGLGELGATLLEARRGASSL